MDTTLGQPLVLGAILAGAVLLDRREAGRHRERTAWTDRFETRIERRLDLALGQLRAEIAAFGSELRAEIAALRSDLTQVALAMGARPQTQTG